MGGNRGRNRIRPTYFNPLLGEGGMVGADKVEVKVKQGFTHYSGVVHYVWYPEGGRLKPWLGRHKLFAIEFSASNYSFQGWPPGNLAVNMFAMITVEKRDWISECVARVSEEETLRNQQVGAARLSRRELNQLC